MADRRGIPIGTIGWASLAYLEALMLGLFVWVLIHQVSPPVVDACGKQVAPAFDRSAKP